MLAAVSRKIWPQRQKIRKQTETGQWSSVTSGEHESRRRASVRWCKAFTLPLVIIFDFFNFWKCQKVSLGLVPDPNHTTIYLPYFCKAWRKPHLAFGDFIIAWNWESIRLRLNRFTGFQLTLHNFDAAAWFLSILFFLCYFSEMLLNESLDFFVMLTNAYFSF